MTSALFARAEPIVAEAMTRSGDARTAWLDHACSGDEALRREVESLLAFEHAAARFLERSALEDAARQMSDDLDPAALVGQHIGDYRVDALVGVGGMADVYRVRNLPLARDEALKVLAPSPLVREADRAGVEAEARAASRLNHPNIVTIFAVGEAEGLHFIAMELLDGDTLRQRLAAGRLTRDAVADLAVPLADALAAAHAAGIVHRDLKPENIRFTAGGVLKVLDFGIAAPIAGASAPGAAGTAGYMAPEQARGGAPSPAWDQYAFGVILGEMLGEAQRTDAAAAAIVRRCVADAPDGRFPSTDALAEACRAWRRRLVDRRLTRRRLLQGAAGAVALGAAGVGGWQFAPWQTRIQTLAVLPFRVEAADPDAGYLADGLAATLIERLGTVPALRLKPRSLTAHFRDADDVAALGRRLAAEWVLTGAIRRVGARIFVDAELVEAASGRRAWTARYDQPAQALLVVEEQLAAAIVDDGVGLRLSRAERAALVAQPTRDAAAFDLYLRAVHLCEQETEASYLEARALLHQALERDARFGAGHVQMATTFAIMVVDGLERPTEAWPASSRHTRLALEAMPDAADAHACEAAYEFFFNWNWDAAEAEWRQAMRYGGADLHPDLYAARALQRSALGRVDEALALARQARALDPVTPMFAIREADFLLLSGQAAQAASLYEQVLDEAPGDARALFGLAEAARTLGQGPDAVAHLRRAYVALGQGEVVDGDPLDDDGAEIERLSGRGAVAQLAALRDRAASGRYVSPLDLARQHARLRDFDAAASLFPAALADRAPGLAMVDVDRAWAAMRGDPRFEQLRRRVGLPASSDSGGRS